MINVEIQVLKHVFIVFFFLINTTIYSFSLKKNYKSPVQNTYKK